MKTKYRKMILEQATNLCEQRLKGVKESVIRWARLESIIKKKKKITLRLFILFYLGNKRRIYAHQSEAIGKTSPKVPHGRKKK